MGRSLLIGALAGDGRQRIEQVLLGQRHLGGLDGQLDVGHVRMQQNPMSTNTRVLSCRMDQVYWRACDSGSGTASTRRTAS
jgi:hypothetical protein